MSILLAEAQLVELFGAAQPSPIEEGKKAVRKLMNSSYVGQRATVPYRVVLTNGTQVIDRSEPRYAELESGS